MILYPSTTDWRGKDWDVATDDEKATRTMAESLAWSTLRSLTGGALSTTPTAVRPNKPSCNHFYIAPAGGNVGILDPYIGLDGRWRNDAHGAFCQCNDRRDVILPGPISKIDSVTIDGSALASNNYRVDSNSILVRLDGQGWPVRQDMYVQPGDVGSFVVTYWQGSFPDELDNYAAGVLAKEYLTSIVNPKGNCRLPRNVTAVTRQGVSFELQTSAFANGVTGIPEVDAVVARHNPYQLKTPARVSSIDLSRSRRTTTSQSLTPPQRIASFSTASSLTPDPANPGYFADTTLYSTGT